MTAIAVITIVNSKHRVAPKTRLQAFIALDGTQLEVSLHQRRVDGINN